MLIFDFYKIGNNLYNIRKERRLTQSEVAERANLSDRTYADIERGKVNMRIDTILRICKALNVSPNDILVENEYELQSDYSLEREWEQILQLLHSCTVKEQRTALDIITTYLNSVV